MLLPVYGCGSASEELEFLDDRHQIHSQLTTSNLQLFDDHSGHLLPSIHAGYCYVIYLRVSRWRLTYCHVHYVRHSLKFRKLLARIEKTRLIVRNERQVLGLRLPFRFRFNFTNGQLW